MTRPHKTDSSTDGNTAFLRAEAARCPTICATDYPNVPNAHALLNGLLAQGELEVVAPWMRGRIAMPAILRRKRT